MFELTVQKRGDYLVPLTDADREVIAGKRNGQGFRVQLVQVSDRSVKFHKLYFGGLIRLLSDYWEPESGLISSYDRKVMSGLIDYVAEMKHPTDALKTLISHYLEGRAEKVKQYVPDNEKVADRLMAIHDWLKEEAGYYDVVLTPTGVKKKVKSINFNAMKSQDEFNEFYQKAFGVAWRYVFSKNNFKDQKEAEDLAFEMSRMG
tara:strand:- start:17272 stop:17883 length:612 start_codon:yes stop_codon:yes gene_type:complete